MKNKTQQDGTFFFRNTACAHFPCHNTENPQDFNCLFCYCPLYALGENCGGDFTYTAKGVKDCSNCLKPHARDSFDMIEKRFPELAELARAKPKE
jgi:Zn-finger protein